MPGVLEGVQVLDMASMWATPLAAAYLADQGAEVVKIEPPWGDEARRTFTTPPLANGESRSWLIAGRGKRGIAVDIASPQGRELVYRLARRSDVLLTNFRLPVAQRLGYDYEALRGLNPQLIYVRVSPYGDQGPYANRRGYDRLFQALSGLMRQLDPQRPPVGAGVWAADMSAPWALCYGVALALLHRQRTGQGQMVELSLLHMALAMQAVNLVRVEREVPREAGEVDYGNQALFQPYRCADGLWLVIVVISDKEFASLCQALGLPHLVGEPAFATALSRAENSQPLYEILSGLFVTQPRSAWLRVLQERDVPCAPVLSQREVFDSPQVAANRMMVPLDHPQVGATDTVSCPVQLSDTPGGVRRRAPLLGEHTDAVLRELGYTPGEVELLRQQGVVR